MPFKTAQSRENGKEAFLQIVQLMDDASKGVGRFSRDEAEVVDEPGMPWCLREQVKAVKKQGRIEIAKWPCLVCAKLFDTPEQLVAHSTVHNFDHQAVSLYVILCPQFSKKKNKQTKKLVKNVCNTNSYPPFFLNQHPLNDGF